MSKAGLADTAWCSGRLANGTALEPLSAWAADQEVILESMAFPGHFLSAGSQVRNSHSLLAALRCGLSLSTDCTASLVVFPECFVALSVASVSTSVVPTEAATAIDRSSLTKEGVYAPAVQALD